MTRIIAALAALIVFTSYPAYVGADTLLERHYLAKHNITACDLGDLQAMEEIQSE